VLSHLPSVQREQSRHKTAITDAHNVNGASTPLSFLLSRARGIVAQSTRSHKSKFGHGSFGSQTPFADGIISVRQTIDQRFQNADQSGAWNDGAGAPVEITGIGFFDPAHKQTGRAPNNIEIHPILSIQFLGQPTPATSPTPTPQPSPTGGQWEYQMISAADATSLLNQANTQGMQGWELAGVVVDTGRPDKYVGFLKRKKQ